ncbi:class I SAM-dependent methyltransferase [Candidatus Bathyarchaeota archaeon]|nr:class I SAM-dependent methyltransferase [Candidatus Bathyarchaeota archaeon]
MEHYYEVNKKRWRELLSIHTVSGEYDIEGFLKGGSSLHNLELEALPNVKKKSMLHLQCYFGLDTLSWARRGARITGVDFNEKAIEYAQMLAEKTGLQAKFINCNIYDIEKHLQKQFDIVYTSYGVLCWLHDIQDWARIAARYLKPGGTFFIAEFHPFSWIYDENSQKELKIKYNYWHKDEPDHGISETSYAASGYKLQNKETYEWNHPLGTVVTALVEAGLTIQWIHEYPFSVDGDQFKFMKKDENGYWRLPGDPIPLMYSIKAKKII